VSGGKHDGAGIRRFREKMSGDKRLSAIDEVRWKYPDFWERREQEYGAFFVKSAALLHPWLKKLDILMADWARLMDQAEYFEDTKMKEHLTDNFFIYGYRGVVEYFELIHEHRASLEGSLDFCVEASTVLYQARVYNMRVICEAPDGGYTSRLVIRSARDCWGR